MPWCTSKSTIATLLILYTFCKYFAATATLLIKQKPLALIDSAWCPGGLIAQNTLSFLFIKSLTAAIPAPQDLRIAFLLSGHSNVSAYGSFSIPISPSLGILLNIASMCSLG